MKKVEELKKEAKETSKNRSRVTIFLNLFYFIILFSYNFAFLKLIMEAKRDNPLYKYKPISFYSHGPALPNVQDISKR